MTIRENRAEMPKASVKRKESRRVRLLRLFARARRPLRFAEVLTAFAQHYPAETGGHEALSSTLGALLHSGQVTRVGRGRGMVRYRLARSAPPPSTPRQRKQRLIPDVWAIVDQEYRAQGAPVPTGAVRRALKQRGAWPDRFPRLVAVLEAMTLDSPDARPLSTGAAQSTAALRRVHAAPSRGKVAGFWVPAWAPPQCAISAPTAADALRYAIAAAGRETGMPVSQRELRRWIAAQPPGSWWRRQLSPRRTGAALRNVSLRDGARAGERDAIHVVEGPLTCHGGPPRRYSMGPASQAKILACRITDAVSMLELEVELQSRADLADADLPASLRRRLERTRETAVRVALTSYCGTLDVSAFGLARRRRARALNVIERWQAVTAPMRDAVATAQRIEQRREAGCWRATMTIVRRLATRTSNPTSRQRGMQDLRIIGKAALLTPAEAMRYVVRAQTGSEIVAARPGLVYADARRFPRPEASDRGSTRAVRLVSGDKLAMLDAVDVWCAVQRRAQRERDDSGRSGRCEVIVLLGSVLRDTKPIDALRAHPDTSRARRRTLEIVAQLLEGQLAGRPPRQRPRSQPRRG